MEFFIYGKTNKAKLLQLEKKQKNFVDAKYLSKTLQKKSETFRSKISCWTCFW